MATKVTRLTHKIAIQLHLVAESCTITVLAPGGQSGNFWIHPRMWLYSKRKKAGSQNEGWKRKMLCLSLPLVRKHFN